MTWYISHYCTINICAESNGKVIFHDVLKSDVSTWVHLRSCCYPIPS